MKYGFKPAWVGRKMFVFFSSNAFYPLTCWFELRAIEHAMRRNSAGATRVSTVAVRLFGQFETRLIFEHKLINRLSAVFSTG